MKAWNKYSMLGWPIMIALLLLIICSQITIASYRNTCRIWKTENKRQAELIERLSVWRSKLEDQDHDCMDIINSAGFTSLIVASCRYGYQAATCGLSEDEAVIEVLSAEPKSLKEVQ